MVGSGGKPQNGRENTHCVATLVLWIHWLLNGLKIVKSVDKITTGRVKPYKPVIHGRLTCLRKQPQEKQTGELWVTIHAHMDCLKMYL